jgi:hypothetical protein
MIILDGLGKKRRAKVRKSRIILFIACSNAQMPLGLVTRCLHDPQFILAL